MRAIARLLAVLVAVPAALVAASPAAHAAGTAYYVDAVAGSDANSGTNPAAAWQTLAKVDATTFAPGDSILLHTDQTWDGQLWPRGSGAPGSPITISSYGGGARPHIDGASVNDGHGAVYLQDQSYWTINGLEVTSNSGVDNFGDPNAGLTRSGILVNSGGWDVMYGITITNNYVHDVNGCFACSDYDGHDNGGIVAWTDPQAGLGSFVNMLIQGNTVDHVGRTGIIVDDKSFGEAQPYYVDQASLSRGIRIRYNTVTWVDSDGIMSAGTDGSVIEHNVVGHAGQRTIVGSTEPSSAGIWPAHALNTTVQFNEVYGTLTHFTDGQGFDNDLGASFSKFQYNYSHDNQGGFMLMEGGGIGDSTSPSEGLDVRYNLSVNDSWGGEKGVFTFGFGGPDNTVLENNTVYIPAGSAANVIYCDGCVSATVGSWTFRNNIVENLGTGGYTYMDNTDRWFYPSATGATFDHNVFYGNHPATEPADPFKITSDPHLKAPGATAPYGICSVAGYQVTPSSRAIGSGAVVSENGGLDYFGRVLSATAAPSRGFYEGGTFAGPAALIDGANGFMADAGHSENVVLDGGKFGRSDLSPASVAWLYDGMQSFDLRVVRYSTDPSLLTLWVSSDGIAYTQIQTVETDGHVSPAAALPSGTRFLAAVITTPGVGPPPDQVTSAGLPPQPPAAQLSSYGVSTTALPSTLELDGISITGSRGACQ